MDLTPYSTARALMGPKDSWLGAEDAERLASYAIYEGIYRNVPETFKLVQRGSESNPIYLPTAKTIIETKNRYLAKDWTFALDPKKGSDGERATLALALENLFKRELIWSKFSTQKRFGLIRGDSVWHVVGDEAREPGRRLSVYEVDPASYFPIDDPWNSDKIFGCHLVDPVLTSSGKTVIKRQTYRKEDDGTISYELSWWETGAWDDRDDSVDLKPVDPKDIPEGPVNDPDVNKPVFYKLDPAITSIPVYHIKNNRTPNAPFGTSELAGYETIMAGINQSISDEQLEIVLSGLGLYFTNSGPPVDEEGNETDWKLGPGWVVEGDEGSTFERVTGVSTTAPGHSHREDLRGAMHEAAGIPDVAVGNVDTAVAESGIALAFHMAPILSSNREKEQEILSVTDHMLYDIVTMWLPVFEELTTAARAASLVGDPLPTNRKAVLEEITTMVTGGLVSIAYAQQLVSEKLGYDFPDEMLAAIVQEQADLAAARNPDPFASRTVDELDAAQ